MAMSGPVLGDAIKAAIDALPPPAPGGMDAYRKQVFEAIGTAIVSHIQTYAAVNAQVTVTSVAGVTPGPGASGPGTGATVPTPGVIT